MRFDEGVLMRNDDEMVPPSTIETRSDVRVLLRRLHHAVLLNQMLSTTNTKLPMLMNNTAIATESYSSQRRLAVIMAPTHCSNAVFLLG